jgi:O-antigen/teichoic acid export membrane protein
MKEDSLKKRYSFKLIASIVSGLIGAILIAIVPKALGPIAYGQFVYLQNFFLQLIGFLDMGSSIAFFTKLSAKHTRKELITFYFFYSLFLFFFVLAFIFAINMFNYTSNILPNIPNEYIYMGLFFGFFSWLTQVFIKISDAYALTVSVELIKIGHKISSLLLLLYFVYFTTFNLESYFYFNYIALISFLFILVWLFVKKNIFKNIINLNFSFSNLIKEFMHYCHPLLVFSILSLAGGMVDIWLLQKYGGSEQTGFYGLAYSLVAVCFIFTSSMIQIISREFAKSYESRNIANMRALFYRYVPMLYGIATFFSVFIAMQSEHIIEIFTDDKYKDAYLVLMIMAFYPIHQTYGQLSGSIMYATNQTKLIRNISFLTVPLGITLTFCFIYLLDLQAIGLAYKMIIAQLIGVNIQLYFNSKMLNLKIKYFIFHQVYTIVFFVILAYIASYILSPNFSSQIANFIISGLIYTFFVIIFAYIFPQVFATTKDEIKNVFNKILNKIKG